MQPLPVGRVLLTEAGAKPRILEVDRAGRVVAEVPLRAQTKDHHLQTRMTRKLASGHYLVPQLLDRVVREYDPAGKVVWEVKTPHMPFTAIRLPDGRRGLRALDLATGREPVRFAPPVPPAETYGLAEGLVVTADGRRAAAVVSDGTAVVWDLSRAALVAAGPIDLRKLWEDLGTADAVRAWRAVWRLAEAPPGRLVPFLRERLKPLTPADEAAVRKLVAGLDADHFAAREEASKALLRRGRGAAPLLRGLPRPSRSPEARRRLRAVLDELGRQPPTPGVAHAARAIAALGQVRAPAARRLLGELVNGAGGGPWTRETKELPWRASIVQDGTARIAVGVWPSEAARCGACPDRLYSAAGDPSPRSESCER